MAYSYYHTIILPVRRNIQDTNYDCGPASLKIVLETLGRSINEESLMKICKTKPQIGTNPSMLSEVLKKLEIEHKIYLHATIELIEEKIRELNFCVINYQAWGENGEQYKNLETGHYSVVFGFNKNHLFVADPSKKHTNKQSEWGFRTIHKKLLNERWEDKIPEGPYTFHWMMKIPLVQKYCSVLKKTYKN